MPRNLFDLSGRIAVVTGAASGLAQGIAIAFAEYGADLVAADIDESGLRTTHDKITALGRRALTVLCDVSKTQEVDALFAEVDKAFERVDILVNGPFWFNRVKPEEVTYDDWNRCLAISLTGYFLCAQAAGRRMIRQGTGGSIINISSIAGNSALGRGNFPYSVAKGGIDQMTRELATEWAKHNIRVNALKPVQMKTPSVKAWLTDPKTDPNLIAHLLEGIPMNRLGEVEDILGPAIFLASDAAAFVTGVLLPVDGGNLALNAGGSHTW
jgi:NAD(P)-dependent dehydrogenase (short-subunit alcohol dehydrogenase family)